MLMTRVVLIAVCRFHAAVSLCTVYVAHWVVAGRFLSMPAGLIVSWWPVAMGKPASTTVKIGTWVIESPPQRQPVSMRQKWRTERDR